jgi:hypothetical protein
VRIRESTRARAVDPLRAACLVRVRHAVAETKGVGIPACNVRPSYWWRAASWGYRLDGMRSDLHAFGLLTVKGTPAFWSAAPFAGGRLNESLGRFMRTMGVSSLSFDEATTCEGCSRRLRGGEPAATSFCGSRQREARSFTRGNSARATHGCCLTISVASGGRIEVLPASSATMGQ